MWRNRIWTGVALTSVLFFGLGATALANANAHWNPAFNDPERCDISDISGVLGETVVHRDAMEDVRRALLLVPQSVDQEVRASDSAIDDLSPRAYRPRAPPAP